MFIVCSVYPNLRHVRFRSLAFQKHHPCLRRILPCSIHTPANQTSRIKHGTHASKPPPKSPQKYSYVEHGVICAAWYERLINAQALHSERLV
jgi:hypothetical protein